MQLGAVQPLRCIFHGSGADFFVVLGTLQAGCHKSPVAAEDDHQKLAAAQSVATLGSAKQSAPVQELAVGETKASRAPAAARIIAIGDLHGDLKATKRAFMLGGATNEKDQWVGGQLVVVQTGDVLDRGQSDREVLAFLDQEESAAKRTGGHVYRLNGNHEIMNVEGDYRYVSEQGFKAFAGEPSTGRPDAQQRPAEQRGRAEAFLPGGRMARKLSEYPIVWIVGDSVFAHGGVLPKHVRYGLDEMNSEIGAWMRGEAPLPKKLQGDNTPFWIRDYGEQDGDEVCAKLETVLTALKATRLVVGHTPQKAGISFGCNQHLARIDVGLSAYYGNNPTEVLEIADGKMQVLKETTENAARVGGLR